MGQLILINLNNDFESCIVLDCVDIKQQKHYSDWLNYIYRSWKAGQGWRNLIAVDLKGEIRAVTSLPCGFTNDQFVLAASDFFKAGTLAPGTTAMGDGGFTGNNDFPIDRPFNKVQVKKNPLLKPYNKALSKQKNIVERIIGILLEQFQLLQNEYRYRPSFFPLLFRVCCMLTNRHFRL